MTVEEILNHGYVRIRDNSENWTYAKILGVSTVGRYTFKIRLGTNPDNLDTNNSGTKETNLRYPADPSQNEYIEIVTPEEYDAACVMGG